MFDVKNLHVFDKVRVQYPPGSKPRTVTIVERIESSKYNSGVGYRVSPDMHSPPAWPYGHAHDSTYDSNFFHPATEEATVTASKFWLVWADNGGVPTVKHPAESDARREAERLARKCPGQKFHVLESMGTASTPDIVWSQHQEEMPF